MNRCADRRPTWAELRIVLNGLKRGQAALNCGRSGPEARNNQMTNAQKSVRLCDQEMKNPKTEYKGTANSMKALQSTQEALKNKQDAYNRVLAEAKAGQQHAKENYRKTGEAIDQLKDKLEKAREELTRMEKAGNTSALRAVYEHRPLPLFLYPKASCRAVLFV